MKAKEVKEHFKTFFGKDIPEPHVEFFGSEFIEFCQYIVGAEKKITPVLIEDGEGAWGVSITSSNPNPEDYFPCDNKAQAEKLFDLLSKQ